LGSVVSEFTLIRHQLLILNRGQKRASNLRVSDRMIAELCTLLMRPARVLRFAIVLRPSTLLHFHHLLIKRKYRQLFSPHARRRPGPKGPEKELIDAVVEMKRRNPTRGCPRIAEQITLAFGVDIDKDVVRRILGMHKRPESGSGGPSWLTFLGNAKDSFLVRHAIQRQSLPGYLSTDNDPLYRLHQWWANLRVLEVMEIKTVPYVPISHPFVERLVGTLRRECLDPTSFWTTPDLEAKLLAFRDYFNGHRCHAGSQGRPPEPGVDEREKPVSLVSYGWRKHCPGLYQAPIAA
jgi:hypothetical protein